MTKRHIREPDYFLAKLRPLLEGQAVTLVVEQERTHGRMTRLVQKGLLIAPGTVYGLHDQALVVSLLGSGSCVIFLDAQKSKGELVKAGLPARLAIALIESLKNLYGDLHHGTATTSTTCPPKRRSRTNP